jgi:hypothetical protein
LSNQVNTLDVQRNVFLLVVLIGLALSLNATGLLCLVDRYVPPILPLRALASGTVLCSGGLVGVFSKRITLRVSAWPDGVVKRRSSQSEP